MKRREFTKSILVRTALSAVIAFQLIGAIFVPNLSSYTGMKLSRFYLPYMNGLGLGGIWSFFAPEPFSPPMFIDYTLERQGAEPLAGRYPEANEKFFFRAPMNRRVSLARFILSDEKHIENMFMNYICHAHPETISAKIWSVRGLQPDYNMVLEQGKKMSETFDYQNQFVGEFACKRKP